MIATQNYQKKSTYLLLAFSLILLIMGVVSELFQAPKNPFESFELYENPLPQKINSHLTKLHISNRVGSLTLEKLKDESGEMKWMVTSPRRLMANQTLVEQIHHDLKNLKVKKLYEKDSVNIGNFSLNSPLYKIDMTIDGTIHHLEHGLISPINNSSYMSLRSRKLIFQIAPLKVPLESLNLGDFIDSRIFTPQLDQLIQIKMAYGKRLNSPYVNLKLSQGNWTDSKGRRLNAATFDKFMQRVLKTHASIILDSLEDDLSKKFEKIIERPQFSVALTNLENKEMAYDFSYPLPSIPELKIEKKSMILVRTPHSKHLMLLPVQFLNYFKVRESKLRQSDIKKLFY